MTDNTKLAELDRPDVKKLTTEAGSLAANYEDFAVTNAIGYRDAAEDLKIIKGQLNQVNEKRLEITRPMDAAKKAVMDFFKPVVSRLEDAERHVKRAMVEWKAEEDRKAREAQRLEQERARKREEKLRKEAEAKREAGKEARADILEDRAEATQAAPVAPAAPKVEGISTRKVWKFEVLDKTQLPAEYLIANEKAIGGVVRALKGDTNIPGVRVYSEDVVSARS